MGSMGTGQTSAGLTEALERQARQIGQALHDDCGQLLAAVYLALADVHEKVPLAVRSRLQRVTHLLDQVEEGLRQLSHELHPRVLDDVGLYAALEMLARGVARRARVTIVINCPRRGRLPREVEAALYRIIQEALSNVARHARAANVRIGIRPTISKVICLISDDGVGFRVTPVLTRKGQTNLGMQGIRSRVQALGGKLSVRSAIGRGTSLIIRIPLPHDPPLIRQGPRDTNEVAGRAREGSRGISSMGKLRRSCVSTCIIGTPQDDNGTCGPTPLVMSGLPD